MATIVPSVEVVGDAALTNSIVDRSITELQDNLVTALGQHALNGCTALKKVVFGAVNECNDNAMNGCTVLEVADFHQNVSIGKFAFTKCPALRAVILRSSTLCSLAATSAFTSSGIAAGTGYIYVPAALVDSYKTAKNWSTYANQIRAIEDYPEVCSTVGKVWAKIDGMSANTYDEIIFVNGLWLTYAGRRYSTDGKTWELNSSAPASLSRVTYANGLFVAISSTDVYYSEDGLTWAKGTLDARASGLNNVTYAGGLWFVSSLSTATGLFYSVDGKSFIKSNATDGYYGEPVYANGMWVVGGSYTTAGLYYSTDGINWTRSNVTNRMNAVAYGGGVWVAGNTENGSSYYSTDGMSWSKCTGELDGRISHLLFDDGLWIASTYYGFVYSSDGKTWVKSSINSGEAEYVCYANEMYIGCAANGLFYSYDGMNWTQSNFSGESGYVCYGDGMFVATCDGGLYYSE